MQNWQISNQEIQKDLDSIYSKGEESLPNLNMPLWFQDTVNSHWLFVSHTQKQIGIRIAVSKLFWVQRVVMPPYIQTVNFIGSNESIIDSDFLKYLSDKFTMGILSTKTLFTNIPSGIHLSSRDNFVVHLDSSYEAIRSAYEHGHRQGINKFHKNNCTIDELNDVNYFLDFYFQNRPIMQSSPIQDRKVLFALLTACKQKGKGNMLQAISPDGKPIGCAFFVHHQHKVVYLLSAKNKEGKIFSAIHSIIDYMIQKNCGKNIYIDFEGSMNPKIAYFMKAFGAKKEAYYSYEWNHNLLLRFGMKIKRWITHRSII